MWRPGKRSAAEEWRHPRAPFEQRAYFLIKEQTKYAVGGVLWSTLEPVWELLGIANPIIEWVITKATTAADKVGSGLYHLVTLGRHLGKDAPEPGADTEGINPWTPAEHAEISEAERRTVEHTVALLLGAAGARAASGTPTARVVRDLAALDAWADRIGARGLPAGLLRHRRPADVLVAATDEVAQMMATAVEVLAATVTGAEIPGLPGSRRGATTVEAGDGVPKVRLSVEGVAAVALAERASRAAEPRLVPGVPYDALDPGTAELVRHACEVVDDLVPLAPARTAVGASEHAVPGRSTGTSRSPGALVIGLPTPS